MSQVLSDRRGSAPPAVSIVVPVYNVAPYVAECLDSIRTQEVPLELILIDDGSTDDSPQVVESQLSGSPDVLWLRQARRGLSAVRNLGARLARGEYLGFLDSDDRLMPQGLGRLLSLAKSQGCDLALGRTRVFDSATRAERPFYDHALWDLLLEGRADRLFTARDVPQSLSLEPNANYRLIRRQFWLDEGLCFPEGLFFEDPPVHFHGLLKARRIGLFDVPYYGYRVNRPGKITEEQGARRFDVLQVSRLALAVLQANGAAADQAGAALRVLFRLVWGCGVMTLPADRLRFFGEACALFAGLSPDWLAAYQAQHARDPRHLVLGALLTGGGAVLLAGWSLGRRNALALGRFLLRHGQGQLLARSGWAWLRGRTASC